MMTTKSEYNNQCDVFAQVANLSKNMITLEIAKN